MGMERHVGFEGLCNFRDLGGYRAADGRTVVWGAVYRADSLGKLRGADWERFVQLGIRTVIDLRYPWEADAKGRVPEAERFRYANLSIEHRPYDQAEIDPDVDPWRYLADRFAEVGEEQVLADFALTELATGRLTADWRAAHPGRVLKWPGYGRAPAEIMELVFADLTARYGSVDGYLKDRVLITDGTADRLRARLLTAAPADAPA
jgi:protein-tyrosine phosphatase